MHDGAATGGTRAREACGNRVVVSLRRGKRRRKGKARILLWVGLVGIHGARK
jgi:hypothetical protein